MSIKRTYRIGTRASPLALAQTEEFVQTLLKKFPTMKNTLKVVTIQTSGDKIKDKPLVEFGGKALFTKEIEEALLRQEIDFAVHSMKDIPAMLPTGLIIPCMLKREDPREAFISLNNKKFQKLKIGATIGTSSLRRKAQALSMRSDFHIIPFRGNVQTRLKKLEKGETDGTFLALAGLKRLKLVNIITEIFDTETMLPAIAQGAIGIECRKDDHEAIQTLSHINHSETFSCVSCERSFMQTLNGSCRMPIGGYAKNIKDKIIFKGFIGDENNQIIEASQDGLINEAVNIGKNAALKIKAQAR